MKPERFRLISTLSIVALALAVGACHQPEENTDGIKNAAEALEKALAPREVELVTPEIRNEQPSVQLVGEIRASDIVLISAEIGGKVDRVLVEVGDRVAKGAPLIEVDRETFAIYLAQSEANVEAARADLALAEKDLERKTGSSVGRDHPPGDPRPGPGGLRSRQGPVRRRRSIHASRPTQLRPERHSRTRRRRHHRANGRRRPVGRCRRRFARDSPRRQGQDRRPGPRVLGRPLCGSRDIQLHRREPARRTTPQKSTASNRWSARPAGHSRSSAPRPTTGP